MGRPSDYTPELVAEICSRISEGDSLRTICLAEDMPAKSSIFRWLLLHEEFRDQYELAAQARSDVFAEDMLDIADDGTNDWVEKENKDGSTYVALNTEHVQRSRLRIDTRKWIASKLKPKKYGDKIVTEHTGPGGAPLTPMMAIVTPGDAALAYQEALRRASEQAA